MYEEAILPQVYVRALAHESYKVVAADARVSALPGIETGVSIR